MEKYIDFAKKYNVTYVKVDEEIWFKAYNCTSLLGYSNKSKAIQMHVPQESKCLEKVLIRNSCRPNTIFINTTGFRILISKSKLVNAREMAKELDMEVNDFHTVRMETSTINFIMNAFKGQKMRTQKRIDNYIIDLYFPKYRIAVECDEKAHFSKKHQEEDAIRQKYLEEEYGIEFVRYRPEKSDADIARCINEIFTKILHRV